MEDHPSRADLMEGRPLRLSRLPTSPQALALTQTVTALAAQQSQAKRRVGPGKLRTLAATLGPILGGLLHAAERQRVASVQKGHRAAWTASTVGHRDLWARLGELHRAGLIGLEPGTKGEVMEGVYRGQPTRVWAAGRLLAMTEQAGISLADLDAHWTLSEALQTRPDTLAAVDAVIVRDVDGWLSAARIAGRDGDFGAAVAAVQRLNEHVSGAVIRGCRFPVLQRRCGGDLRLGGRLYAVGEGDNYQKLPKGQRARITIDGEQVCEVDATASLLSVFLGLTGRAVLPTDPYAIGGLPREAVKQCVVQTLGQGHFLTRWARGTDDTARLVPLGTVQAALRNAYPELSDLTAILPLDLLSAPPPRGVHWAAGQFLVAVEAEVLQAALDSWHGEGVVSLPIFDGLIVRRSDADAAQRALAAAYLVRLGAAVRVSVKA